MAAKVETVADPFEYEDNVRKWVRPWAWLSVPAPSWFPSFLCAKTSDGKRKLLSLNWRVSLAASAVLWTFIALCINDDTKEDTFAEFTKGQKWVTQNFTWLYIGTQNVWAVFLIWLTCSKYGAMKLGKKDEKPEYDNLTWFAMLFSCGIGTGLYYWGVSEPMYYYRASYGNELFKTPFQNDDQRAQQALTITLFHWGVHGWVVYTLVAVLLGFVAYRWDMPMTVRSGFYPLLGDAVFGIAGDAIDALSIACTTFGVCTSLGFGVEAINAALHRLNDDIPIEQDWEVGIVWVITAVATVSVLSGIKRGIKTLSLVCFFVGCLLLCLILFVDNTWFLMNSFVQSWGHYLQYVIQLGHETDTFEQLNLEFEEHTGSELWGSNGDSHLKDTLTAIVQAADPEADNTFGDPAEFFGSHASRWIDWWTIFYWGWWISWAPFVGFFIAKISRGRTIREVVWGGFFAPITFTFFWLTTFGSLGIKMERAVELATNVAPDIVKGSINCTQMGYDGATPVSDVAVALADEGYYALACRASADRILDVVEPYGNLAGFLHVLILVGVFLYFITSSDSGSLVDDILGSSGLSEPPALQKVYWCCTEGAAATALLVSGGGSISALQAASICAGFPYTIALCFACTALLRACKKDEGDDEFTACTGAWNTSVFDIFDGFRHVKRNADGTFATDATAPGAVERALGLVVSTVCPFFGLQPVVAKISPYGTIHALLATACFYAWFILLIIRWGGEDEMHYVGWTFYIIFVCYVAWMRTLVRQYYKIYDTLADDFFTTLVMYPFSVAQVAAMGNVGGASKDDTSYTVAP